MVITKVYLSFEVICHGQPYTKTKAILKTVIISQNYSSLNYVPSQFHYTTSVPIQEYSVISYSTFYSRGWHSNIFYTPIFVLSQDENQGTTTEIAGGQKSNCLLKGWTRVNLTFYVEYRYYTS